MARTPPEHSRVPEDFTSYQFHVLHNGKPYIMWAESWEQIRNAAGIHHKGYTEIIYTGRYGPRNGSVGTATEEERKFTLSDLFAAFKHYAFATISNQPYSSTELSKDFDEWYKERFL